MVNLILEGKDSELAPEITFSWKKLLLSIIIGSIIYETIGFMQAFLAWGAMREFSENFIRDFLGIYPGYLVIGNPLIVFLGFAPFLFCLIFEIPWIVGLKFCHNKKKDWPLRRTLLMYTGVIGLALLPILLIQVFGIPEIPFFTERIRVTTQASLNTAIFSITPLQFMTTYWVIALWLVSWCYLMVLVFQYKTLRVIELKFRALMVIWIIWVCFLAVSLLYNPVLFFTTPKL